MANFFETVLDVLRADERFFTAEGELLRNAVYEAAMKMDPKLIKMLFENPDTKARFFTDVDGIAVFDKVGFGWVINNREFLPNSYTRYKNKIGLVDGKGEFISTSNDVELVFPYKDCFLEGGQTREDQKKKEIFYNATLAPDEVDRLLSPKVFSNAIRYADGKETPAEILDGSDNLVIKGNNLLSIASLLKNHEGMIKLIYIDPPYNTSGDFNTFMYNNSFNHSSWLTFMKNRIELSYRLLSDDGVICIAIDDYEYAHLKVLCDDIFGIRNYVGTIVVQSMPSGTTSNSYFANCHEYCLFYAKNIDEVVVKSFDLTAEQAKAYKYEDEEGFYKWRDFMRTGGTSTPDVRPNSFYPIYFDPATDTLSLENKAGCIEVIPIDSSGKKRVWRQTRPSFLELNSKGELKCVNKNGKYSIRIKDRIKDGMKPKTIWYDAKYSATSYGTELLKKIFDGEKVFSYPKSIHTVKDIIRMMGDSDDIVLDFFGGSGTTAQAVIELNVTDKGTRRFILCEQMDYARNVTFERIKRVTKQMGVNVPVVYCELKKLNQIYADRIQSAQDDETLEIIWNEMQATGFISSKIDPKDVDPEADDFKALSLENKKHLLMELLDLNQLYVNYCDIDDETFGVSEADKTFTKSFYGEE